MATDQVVELPVRAEGLAEGPQAPSKGSTPGGPEALGVLPPQAPGQGAPAGGSPGTACGRVRHGREPKEGRASRSQARLSQNGYGVSVFVF